MDGFFLNSSMFFDVFSLKKDQYNKDAQYLVFESVLYVNFGGLNGEEPGCWLNLMFLFVGRISPGTLLQLHPFGAFWTVGQQIMRFMDAMYVQ